MQPPFTTASPYPQTGEVLDGKYRVERLLGEGGMGAVAKATHLLRRAPVALKFMSGAVLSLQGAVERFVNEGVAASQIDSDHVVKVFDVGRLPSGAPYLVMEYLEGCDLGQLLEREGQLIAPTRAIHFTLQILRALQTAHAAGIVHRDMKPSNCFVINKDGEPDFIKLVDFGISKVRATDDAQGAHLTRTNSALGTPLYMSPEQARSPRDVDHRTDLYSVGAILYEMLTGRTPYTAESGEYTEILFKIFTTEPAPLQSIRPDIPVGIANAVHRALLRDRDARFGSAAEMAEALAPFADDRSNQVLSRLLLAKGRSVTPGGMGNTPAPGAPVDAHAQTYAGSEGLRAPKVPTDVGVTREAAGVPGQTGARGGRAGIAIGVAAVALLMGAAGFVVVHGRSSTAAKVPPEPAAAALAPQPPAQPLPSAQSAPVATLETLPAPTALAAASASASASPADSSKKAAPVRPAPANQPALPRQLGDLQLH
jgi:eukaryotic-like serine/threonine-protein kinase